MGITQIRSELQEIIDSDDEKLLRMFYVLAKAYKSDSSDLIYPELSEAELAQEVREAEDEIDRGEYDEIGDFEKKSDKWD